MASYSYAGTVDGNAANPLNFTPNGIPTPADSLDSITANITTGTISCPITSNSAVISAGVICSKDVINDMGTFNGTCSGYLTDIAGNGATGTVLNGGGNLQMQGQTWTGITVTAGILASNEGYILSSSISGTCSFYGSDFMGFMGSTFQANGSYDFVGISSHVGGTPTFIAPCTIRQVNSAGDISIAAPTAVQKIIIRPGIF